MKQSNSADIDVYNVFVRIKKSLVGGLVLLFKALDFVRQNWRIIALLILVGAALGYFGSLDSKKAQKASVMLKNVLGSARISRVGQGLMQNQNS